MSEGNVHIDLEGNILEALKSLDTQFKGIEKRISEVEKTNHDAFDNINKQLNSVSLSSLTQQFQNLTQSLNELNGPGLQFESQLADLSAITGQTGRQLEKLGEMARENAKEFGGSAARSVETFKLLLSQLGPDLAKTPVLLNSMARNAETLAKTMGGDVVGAVEVLTTAMNQYNVDLTNPQEATRVMTEMMNTMSAAAKEGSAELPIIKQAIENVGGQAKISGLQFNELNSAIQELDKAGKKGAEGGTALRSILTVLGKGRFIPENTKKELIAAGVSVDALADKNVKFTDKMRMLQPVLEKDSALINALFGEYGQAASALILSADAQDEMTAKIKDTNTAFDQAAIFMETTEQKVARMQASIDDAKISFFEATGGVTAFLGPISELSTTVVGLSAAVQLSQGAWQLMNKTMLGTPVGLIVAGLASVAAAAYLIVDGFTDAGEAANAYNDVQDKLNDKLADERVELDMSFRQLKQTKEGTDERKKAVDELNAQYPDLLKNYDLEKASLNEINAAHKDVVKNISNRLEAEIKIEKAKELARKIEEYKSSSAFGVNEWTEEAKWERIREMRATMNQLIDEASSLNGSGEKKTPNTTDNPQTKDDPKGKSTPFPRITDTGKITQKDFQETNPVKSIVVNIQTLMGGNVNIHSKTIKEGATKLQDAVSEALIGAVRDFEVSIR